MIARLLFILIALLVPAASVQAHALEPGYLQISQLTPDTFRVFRRTPDVKGAPMAIDALLPPECSPRAGPAPRSDGPAWSTFWVATCPNGLAGGVLQVQGLVD